MSLPHTAPSDASAFPHRRGLPSWAAILLAALLMVIGMVLDGLTTGALSWGLRIGFLAGVTLAALTVRRGSIFTAMVQPPILLAIAVYFGTKMVTDASGLTAIALRVVSSFPTMVIGTAAALAIGMIRIIAQPTRSRRHQGRSSAGSYA